MIKVDFKEISYEVFDRRAVRSAMGRAARAMAAKLRQTAGGGGRSRRRRGAYQASAPGEPPNRYTGALLRSMKGRRSRRGYALVVQASAPHAHLLELGTNRMEPRPYFAPTFANREEVIGLLRTAYDRALQAKPGAGGRPPKQVEIN